eukprot:TRINITY_DN9756_c0_g1_i1.p1 TRINITY_DN9756_c0_g1~~TRINITY_DN9756_c0_g1_i1.p1  ORF type:complete len:609 (+),score=94.63 TRINITY_DN9756_c0_g1_i1:44-1870(+)
MLVLNTRFKRCISTLATQERERERKKNIKASFDMVPTPFRHFGKVPDQSIFRNDALRSQPHLIKEREMLHSMPVKAKVGRIEPDAVRSFAQMDLAPQVMVALKEMEIEVPSAIQQLAIPVALEGRSTRLCSATGTGKTVAMLAPIFSMMLKDKYRGLALRENRPRCVILAPTIELVHQLWNVATKFCNTTGLEVREIYGEDYYVQNGFFDIAVATPSGYRLACERGYIVPNDVKYMAIDEADLLIGGTFYGEKGQDAESLYANLLPLLEKQFERDSYLGRHKVQFLLASAAVSEQYEFRVLNLIPHVNTVQDPNAFHVSPMNTKHNFLHVSEAKKFVTLTALLGASGNQREQRFRSEELNNKRNFWFPDAVTFETGQYGPMQEGSFIKKGWNGGDGEVGDPLYRRLLNSENRSFYKQDYSEEASAPKALAPPPRLILPESDSAEGTTSIIPIVNKDEGTHYMVPTKLESPVMIWGPQKAFAAPFTGLPPLCPQKEPPKGKRIIVFFQSKLESIRAARRLTQDGYRVAMLHSVQGVNSHKVRVSEFEKWATGECNILLTTDIAARGLDFHVDQVINYDLPKYPTDYLLRCGRTGRMGRYGMVTTLVNVS